MFAPPICRRRWRNNAFRSVSSDEDGGNPANIAASGASNQTQRDPQRAAASNPTQREPLTCERREIARRRAEEKRAEAFFLAQPGSRLLMLNVPDAARMSATTPKTTDKIR